MDAYLADTDVTLYKGDAVEVLRELPNASVDCCISSPPYFGLRDYGVDGQVGLENTPQKYVERLVEIFQEVRRVLAPHGTVWLNLGDSYASQPAGNKEASGFSQTRPSRQKHGVGPETVDLPKLDSGVKPKDLVGIPWMTAFALRADGWYLRSDIIWDKPNPMPESITDRPTKAHEYIFLLSKNLRYYFDQEAVREPAEWNRWGDQTNHKYEGQDSTAGWIKPKTKHELMMKGRKSYPSGGTTGNRGAEHIKGSTGGMPSTHPAGRNIRSVWEIPTQPYAEAHFATFPQELVRRALLAGCPEWVCRKCGKPRERIVEKPDMSEQPKRESERWDWRNGDRTSAGQAWQNWRDENPNVTTGWTDCGHDDYRRGIVLDPFMGSGTTALVARNHQRHSVGIDLNQDYCELAARRLSQLSLLV